MILTRHCQILLHERRLNNQNVNSVTTKVSSLSLTTINVQIGNRTWVEAEAYA